MLSSLLRLLLILNILFLSACNTIPMKVDIQSSSTLNASLKHQSLPVALRIYGLKDIDTFRLASFHQLWKRDKDILKDELVFRKTITVNPGDVSQIQIQRQNDVHYIGVVALFRQYHLSTWRTYTAIPSIWQSLLFNLRIVLTKHQVSIQ